jgi:hypothetical protein
MFRENRENTAVGCPKKRRENTKKNLKPKRQKQQSYC